ncbi:hypothetical protein HDU67_003592 [Dinochytrium kinnereticum]|nr:hypothetical protein HDU67_003592 [Dinochytrium kinnereticum]
MPNQDASPFHDPLVASADSFSPALSPSGGRREGMESGEEEGGVEATGEDPAGNVLLERDWSQFVCIVPLASGAGMQGMKTLERISAMLRRKEEELLLERAQEMDDSETTFERKIKVQEWQQREQEMERSQREEVSKNPLAARTNAINLILERRQRREEDHPVEVAEPDQTPPPPPRSNIFGALSRRMNSNTDNAPLPFQPQPPAVDSTSPNSTSTTSELVDHPSNFSLDPRPSFASTASSSSHLPKSSKTLPRSGSVSRPDEFSDHPQNRAKTLPRLTVPSTIDGVDVPSRGSSLAQGAGGPKPPMDVGAVLGQVQRHPAGEGEALLTLKHMMLTGSGASAGPTLAISDWVASVAAAGQSPLEGSAKTPISASKGVGRGGLAGSPVMFSPRSSSRNLRDGPPSPSNAMSMPRSQIVVNTSSAVGRGPTQAHYHYSPMSSQIMHSSISLLPSQSTPALHTPTVSSHQSLHSPQLPLHATLQPLNIQPQPSHALQSPAIITASYPSLPPASIPPSPITPITPITPKSLDPRANSGKSILGSALDFLGGRTGLSFSTGRNRERGRTEERGRSLGRGEKAFHRRSTSASALQGGEAHPARELRRISVESLRGLGEGVWAEKRGGEEVSRSPSGNREVDKDAQKLAAIGSPRKSTSKPDTSTPPLPRPVTTFTQSATTPPHPNIPIPQPPDAQSSNRIVVPQRSTSRGVVNVIAGSVPSSSPPSAQHRARHGSPYGDDGDASSNAWRPDTSPMTLGRIPSAKAAVSLEPATKTLGRLPSSASAKASDPIHPGIVWTGPGKVGGSASHMDGGTSAASSGWTGSAKGGGGSATLGRSKSNWSPPTSPNGSPRLPNGNFQRVGTPGKPSGGSGAFDDDGWPLALPPRTESFEARRPGASAQRGNAGAGGNGGVHLRLLTLVREGEKRGVTIGRLEDVGKRGKGRRFLMHGHAWQIITTTSVKNRYLFLFSDVLVMAKEVPQNDHQSVGSRTPVYEVKGVLNVRQASLALKEPSAASLLRKLNIHSMVSYDPHGQVIGVSPVAVAIRKFAVHPIKAVCHLIAKRILPCTPQAIAHFLHTTPGLSRRQMGKFLGLPEHNDILTAYLTGFAFHGLRMDAALRVFLGAFRLPSTLTTIDIILDAFARRWTACNPHVFGGGERGMGMALRLVFAIMALNAEVHGGAGAGSSVRTFSRGIHASDAGALSPTSPRTEWRGEERFIDDEGFVERFFADCKTDLDVRASLSSGGGALGTDGKDLLSGMDEASPGLRAMLEEVHRGIVMDRLEMADMDGTEVGRIQWVFKMEESCDNEMHFPIKLTLRESSPLISLCLPHPVPDLRVRVHGVDVASDPTVLDFSRSRLVSFRIRGLAPGRKLVMFTRLGAGYKVGVGVSSILTRGVLIEPPFMRHKFQLTVWEQSQENEGAVNSGLLPSISENGGKDLVKTGGVRRRYLFAVSDATVLKEWVSCLDSLAFNTRRRRKRQARRNDVGDQQLPLTTTTTTKSHRIRVEGGSNPFGTIPRTAMGGESSSSDDGAEEDEEEDFDNDDEDDDDNDDDDREDDAFGGVGPDDTRGMIGDGEVCEEEEEEVVVQRRGIRKEDVGFAGLRERILRAFGGGESVTADKLIEIVLGVV